MLVKNDICQFIDPIDKLLSSIKREKQDLEMKLKK